MRLNCSYDGSAGVGVSWTKDPQQSIDADSNPCHCAVTFYNSGTGSSLLINVTDGGDLGSYTCTAVFGFGDTCPATVQVLKAGTICVCVYEHVCTRVCDAGADTGNLEGGGGGRHE